MNNPIEEQKLIIDQLYQIVKASCPSDFQHAKCKFVYEKFEDGSSSVETTFYFTKNSQEISAGLDRELSSPVMSLV